MDMSGEKEKGELLPEGWRKFSITGCEEKTSKAGNMMFVITLTDLEKNQTEDVYAIATAGKRWFLKSILKACSVPASADGVYDWDIADIIDKTILGKVEHIDESWINREGDTVTSKKAKITTVKGLEENDLPF